MVLTVDHKLAAEEPETPFKTLIAKADAAIATPPVTAPSGTADSSLS
jgi:hypothetical protein